MNESLRIEHTERFLRRRLAALAFLDVVGYARLVGTNEERALRAWSSLRRTVIEPRLIARRGRVVDRAGDAIFAEFASALDALRWAMEVQEAAARDQPAGEPIRLRIALHLADIIDGPDGEVLGDGVNTTARLQAHAEAGGVIVSAAFVDAVRGKIEAGFVDLGALHLRNIALPVRAYRLEGAAPSRPRWRRMMVPAAGIVVLVPLLAQVPGALREPPRTRAEHLLAQGLAVACTEHPCPRTWLARRALFEQAMAADPSFARPYAEAAITYTNFVTTHLSANEDDDLLNASRLATRAVALAPDQAFAHAARAAVLRQDPDKLEDALGAYLRAAALDPAEPKVRANAGWMLVLLGRPAEGAADLRQALQMAPNHIYASAWLNYLGLAEFFLDHYAAAADLFRQAIARQSHDASAADIDLERQINLAAALALAGETAAAHAVIDKLRPEHPTLSTRNVLGNCDCSHAAAFLGGLAKLRHGAALAGVLDEG